MIYKLQLWLEINNLLSNPVLNLHQQMFTLALGLTIAIAASN